jgi:endogenous inhibitor of DNA gyrase (YacG/DUF329 family)
MTRISLYCPDCQKTLNADDGAEAMKTGDCPDCGTGVEVET